MPRTCKENFERRFGSPPRFIVRYENPQGEERATRLDDIFYGYKKILGSLLGRDPTEAELHGTELIKGAK